MDKISFITLTNNGYKHYTLNCLESLKKFNIEEIDARRAINSKNPAAKTKEVIIYN